MSSNLNTTLLFIDSDVYLFSIICFLQKMYNTYLMPKKENMASNILKWRKCEFTLFSPFFWEIHFTFADNVDMPHCSASGWSKRGLVVQSQPEQNIGPMYNIHSSSFAAVTAATDMKSLLNGVGQHSAMLAFPSLRIPVKPCWSGLGMAGCDSPLSHSSG